ncbi:hypothetical protein GCM10027514_32100 [Azotobacter armeniacus]
MEVGCAPSRDESAWPHGWPVGPVHGAEGYGGHLADAIQIDWLLQGRRPTQAAALADSQRPGSYRELRSPA